MEYLNRKLGLLENLFEILHELGAMIDVNIARIEGPLTPEILQQALDLVQKRHPMLQVHIVELADGFYFQSEGTHKIPLRVIDKQYENQGIEIAQEELHQKFSGDLAPLCRVTFLYSSSSNGISEIIATFHHAITDGMSCMRFFDDLLSYCHKIAASDYIGEVVTMQPLPPLEKLLESRLTSKNNIEEAQEKPSQEIQPPKLIIEREAPPSDRRTHLLTRILSPQMTMQLKERCKQEKTTVHGALCGAMLFGAAKIAFTDTPIHLSCGSSVNVRNLCEPKVNDDYIGDLALTVTENHILEYDSSFWELARECKSKIAHSISCGFPINEKLRNIEKDFIIKISEDKMGRNEIIHISNLGNVKFLDEYGKFKLTELYFAPGVHLIGACFWIGVITFHEQIYYSFAHVIPVVSAKTAELFADLVIETMKQACTCQSLTFNKVS